MALDKNTNRTKFEINGLRNLQHYSYKQNQLVPEKKKKKKKIKKKKKKKKIFHKKKKKK